MSLPSSSVPSSPSGTGGLFNRVKSFFIFLFARVIDIAGVFSILVFILILIGLSIPDFFTKLSFYLDDNQRKTIVRNLGTIFNLKVKFEEEQQKPEQKIEDKTTTKNDISSIPVLQEQNQNSSSVKSQTLEAVKSQNYQLSRKDLVSCQTSGLNIFFKDDVREKSNIIYNGLQTNSQFYFTWTYIGLPDPCVFSLPKNAKQLKLDFGIPNTNDKKILDFHVLIKVGNRTVLDNFIINENTPRKALTIDLQGEDNLFIETGNMDNALHFVNAEVVF